MHRSSLVQKNGTKHALRERLCPLGTGSEQRPSGVMIQRGALACSRGYLSTTCNSSAGAPLRSAAAASSSAVTFRSSTALLCLITPPTSSAPAAAAASTRMLLLHAGCSRCCSQESTTSSEPYQRCWMGQRGLVAMLWNTPSSVMFSAPCIMAAPQHLDQGMHACRMLG